MLKQLLLLLILVSGLTLLGFYFNYGNNIDNTSNLRSAKPEQKNVPVDHFFLQRAYPDDQMDLTAYTKALKAAQLDMLSENFNGFEAPWTVQGPGNIGARINTVAVHPSDENIMYAGFSHGGVWKTTNGGNDWVPVFDQQTFLAIGDIVFDPVDPNIVYVGTGDVNISGLPFIGDGIWKTTDGGDSWIHLGLEDQRIIAKIAIDPTNNQTIFAATMGLPFERNNNRGLYKSTNGGTNWEQVLFLSDSTGIIDLMINPSNPQVIYASGWDRIRNNTESLIVGQGARIFKSVDGGTNWTDLNALGTGLPQGIFSRTGMAMSATNPDIVFAMFVGISQQLQGIYKSVDAGANWEEIPTDPELNELSDNALGGFGWYFGKLRVNPVDDNDLFLLGVDLWRTQNSGQLWDRATPPWWEFSIHADKHDLTFTNEGNILLATDGGLYKWNTTTNDWEDVENIPNTQFYRTAYNPHQPDLYYGGTQDNGSTGGNGDFINEWQRIYGGDGFQMAFHPDNPDIFYAESQNGNIAYTEDGGYSWDSGTDGIDFADRRNWDMQYLISPHNPSILYTGTYRVYQSISSSAPNWFPISEDLTDGLLLHRRFHTITTLDESPQEMGLLYIGTVDGNVWRTDNGGGEWIPLFANLPDRYVTSVKASPDFENNVYVTQSGYKDNDFIPHLHRSTDRGNTWEDISSDLPTLALNDVLLLPGHQDTVIFVAADAGVYGSLDSGDSWARLGGNMPFVPVMDLVHNVAKNELVAATYARGIMTFPLDSIFNNVMSSSVEPKSVPVKKVLKLFPNPAKDYINIAFTNIEPARDAELVILDINGKLVKHQNIAFSSNVNLEIGLTDLPTGNYVVKLKVRHGVYTGNFVKNN